MRPDEPAEHYVFKDGRVLALELGHRWDGAADESRVRSERAAARCAVAAVAELCRDLIRPLEFGVTRHLVGEHSAVLPVPGPAPEHWHRYLRTPRLPAYAEPRYAGARIIDVPVVDEASMLAAVTDTLDEPCPVPAGRWPAWTELYVWHALVRVPEPHVVDGCLWLDDYDNARRGMRVPVVEEPDGGVWVAEPHRGVWPPIAVQVRRPTWSDHPDADAYDEFIALRVHVNWSLWWLAGSPGRAVLDRALDRLGARGWRPAAGAGD